MELKDRMQELILKLEEGDDTFLLELDYQFSKFLKARIDRQKELLSNIEQLKSNEFSINANYNDACLTLEQLLKEYDDAINEKAYNDFVTTIQTGENEAIKLVLN